MKPNVASIGFVLAVAGALVAYAVQADASYVLTAQQPVKGWVTVGPFNGKHMVLRNKLRHTIKS